MVKPKGRTDAERGGCTSRALVGDRQYACRHLAGHAGEHFCEATDAVVSIVDSRTDERVQVERPVKLRWWVG